MTTVKQFTKILLITVFTMFAAMESYSQKNRVEIVDKYKWDLTNIYKNEVDWRLAKDAIAIKINEVEKFKGTLTTSASNLLLALVYESEIDKEASKLYIYAGMHSDLDTRDMKYTGLKQELQQLFSDFGAKSAFMQPEILSVEWDVIEGFLNDESKLEPYRMQLSNMFRQKKHTLSEAEERIMALSGMIGGTPGSIYSTYKDAEMPAPKVTLSNGEEIEVTSSVYDKYRASANRADRVIVFEAYWNNFKKYEATFGEMLYGNVKSDMFRSKARNYESSLESALYANNIPTEVYHSLVKGVNNNLDAFHRYLKIKKRMLGVDTLRYLDLYAPVVSDIDLKYEYDEAAEIILEALKPLGKEYTDVIKKAINDRWIDVYPTPGKRSGAYSNGAFYDGHPFILLNYNDLYDDVSTMAHELGHTMQSYLSNKKQAYPTADYAIFVAEVASTLNEVLLFNHIIDKVDDEDTKLSILMNWLDRFKGTLYRQTQFAEFELKIHETAEAGKPLTGAALSEIYTDIVKAYYGHNDNICHVDDYIEMEWAFIPHFYYNFYVYQYSTSFTASISLAEKIMAGDTEALKKYIDFLSAGGSDYPIELLKAAGVDMTSEEPFDKTIEAMNKVMDEIELILNKKG